MPKNTGNYTFSINNHNHSINVTNNFEDILSNQYNPNNFDNDMNMWPDNIGNADISTSQVNFKSDELLDGAIESDGNDSEGIANVNIVDKLENDFAIVIEFKVTGNDGWFFIGNPADSVSVFGIREDDGFHSTDGRPALVLRSNESRSHFSQVEPSQDLDDGNRHVVI